VTVLRVFCGVLRCFADDLQLFCERCFVQYSRDFWLFGNARNTRAYCDFFECSSVFLCFAFFVCFACFCGNTAKHSQTIRKTPAEAITKHPQNTTKHHKTHLLTKQHKFANKPTLAPVSPAISIPLLYPIVSSYIQLCYFAIASYIPLCPAVSHHIPSPRKWDIAKVYTHASLGRAELN